MLLSFVKKTPIPMEKGELADKKLNPRGWRASELAEQEYLQRALEVGVIHVPRQHRTMVYLAVACLLGILVVMCMTRWYKPIRNVIGNLKYMNVPVKVDSNDGGELEQVAPPCDSDSGTSGDACSCSNVSVSPYRSRDKALNEEGWEEDAMVSHGHGFVGNGTVKGFTKKHSAPSVLQTALTAVKSADNLDQGKQRRKTYMNPEKRSAWTVTTSDENNNTAHDGMHGDVLVAPHARGDGEGLALEGFSMGKSEEHSEINQRVDEAMATLTSISSRMPEDLQPNDKLVWTHMMLETMKVNESVRATKSMGRMENIAREGNEIYGRMEDRKKAKHLEDVVRMRTADVLKTNWDVVFFGVLVMVISGAYFAIYSDRRNENIENCIDRKVMSNMSLLSLVLEAHILFSMLTCYAWNGMEVLQGIACLLLTPAVIGKFGLFRNSEYSTPVFQMAASLSCICGLSGWWAVKSLGGYHLRWLAAWESWIFCHLLIAGFSRRLVHWNAKRRMHEFPLPSWMSAGMWVMSGVAIPVATAYFAFF